MAEDRARIDFASQTDERLMVLYQQGEYGAFVELYGRYSGRVYGFLRKRANVPGEAEDLLQKTFLKVHQNRRRFDATLPFLPWLFSIARHVLIDHLRKHKAIPVEEAALEALADGNVSTAPDSEERPSWDEVMRLLPSEQKRLMELRFQEGLSFDEIAERSGLTSVTVRKRMSRIMKALRRALSGAEGGNRS